MCDSCPGVRRTTHSAHPVAPCAGTACRWSTRPPLRSKLRRSILFKGIGPPTPEIPPRPRVHGRSSGYCGGCALAGALCAAHGAFLLSHQPRQGRCVRELDSPLTSTPPCPPSPRLAPLAGAPPHTLRPPQRPPAWRHLAPARPELPKADATAAPPIVPCPPRSPLPPACPRLARPRPASPPWQSHHHTPCCPPSALQLGSASCRARAVSPV